MRAEAQCLTVEPRYAGVDAEVPAYLTRTYWWAYVHPHSVHFFERQWLVNLILWGNFRRLRDAALDALGAPGGQLAGETLQIACVYGDLTNRLAERLAPEGRLHVVDVLRIQLENLARKLPADLLQGGEPDKMPPRVGLLQGDSAALALESGTYDRALLFFLLHEQPEDIRRKTLAEALRVLRPGGRLVIIDYHRPHRLNPLYWPMVGILRLLEPFALDLWQDDITSWLPGDARITQLHKQTCFGGLYQLVSITV